MPSILPHGAGSESAKHLASAAYNSWLCDLKTLPLVGSDAQGIPGLPRNALLPYSSFGSSFYYRWIFRGCGTDLVPHR